LTLAIISSISTAAVFTLIDAGADVNTVGNDGLTPLMLAIKHSNDKEIILHIIHVGADVNTRNCDCQTPLLYAINYSCNIEVISALISAGADVNVKDTYGRTPLMAAIENSWSMGLEVIQLLLDSGAETNVTNIRGRTPLIIAILHSQRPKITETLLSAGACVNVKDRDGQTPLTLAIALSKSIGLEVIQNLIKSGADVNQSDSYGRTPLIRAILSKREDITNTLLKAGVEVNVTDPQGRTPLLLATMNSRLSAHKNVPICEALLKNSANISCELHSAIIEGLNDTVEKMLQYGAMPKRFHISSNNMPYFLSNAVPKVFISSPVSPLITAFLFNNSHLIQIFTSLNFLNPYDLKMFGTMKKILNHHLEKSGCEKVMTLSRNIFDQPLSLWSLSFLKVSECVGFDKNRHQRISQTGLPSIVQKKLMFRYSNK